MHQCKSEFPGAICTKGCIFRQNRSKARQINPSLIALRTISAFEETLSFW